MSRIIVAECKQEVSSFNPVPSRFEDFRVVRGTGLLDHHRGVREEVGGALSVFDTNSRVELLPRWARVPTRQEDCLLPTASSQRSWRTEWRI